jgi:ligand-binding sensor domain-containing protein
MKRVDLGDKNISSKNGSPTKRNTSARESRIERSDARGAQAIPLCQSAQNHLWLGRVERGLSTSAGGRCRAVVGQQETETRRSTSVWGLDDSTKDVTPGK